MAAMSSISNNSSPTASVECAEWRLLRECASPSPNREKMAALVHQVNWAETLQIAEHHGMLGHLASRVNELQNDSPPGEIMQLLRDRYRAQVLSSMKMAVELFRVIDRLAAAGIEILVMKGPVLAAQAYPDPAVRTFGDLDLLVRQRDIQTSTQVMIAAGYQAEINVAKLAAGKTPGQFLFRHPDSQMIVEMHNEKTLRYFPRPLPIEKVFSRRINVTVYDRQIPTLSVEDALVLICIHGAKHFWDRFMWIADVAGLVARHQIDWRRTEAAAHEIGGVRMLHVGLQLAAKLLNVALPDPIAEQVQRDRAAKQIAKRIVRWLPAAAQNQPTLLQRAFFRMRMRGGIFAAPVYLLRLTFSPTEEDWGGNAHDKRNWALDALRRPLRLARKYGRKR
jgi:hypothetical protein